MKQPEESPAISRKTLPARKAEKLPKASARRRKSIEAAGATRAKSAAAPKSKSPAGNARTRKPQPKTILDKDVQRELVRVFGER